MPDTATTTTAAQARTAHRDALAKVEELRELARNGGTVTPTALAKARDEAELAELRVTAAERAEHATNEQAHARQVADLDADLAAFATVDLAEQQTAYTALVDAARALRGSLTAYETDRAHLAARCTTLKHTAPAGVLSRLDPDEYVRHAVNEAKHGHWVPADQLKGKVASHRLHTEAQRAANSAHRQEGQTRERAHHEAVVARNAAKAQAKAQADAAGRQAAETARRTIMGKVAPHVLAATTGPGKAELDRVLAVADDAAARAGATAYERTLTAAMAGIE